MTGRVDAVGVIGAGAVGQAVAATVVTSGLCGRVLVASRDLADAEALADDLDDLRQATGAAVRPAARLVPELAECAAVVVAVRETFVNGRTTDVRMAGAMVNARAVAELAAGLRGYPGTVLVVTNPVDLMTRLVAEESGLSRVYGIGSNLDSARYRLTLARLLGVPPAAVRGHVIGEHGDAAVVCASSTTVAGERVRVPLDQVHAELRNRPGRISAGIGRTRYGPAGAVLSALRRATGLEDGTEELSTCHRDSWQGTPLHFTGGQAMAALPALSTEEARRLDASAAKLRTAYARLRTTLSLRALETT
jgi:L-lactate dehydrogenase